MRALASFVVVLSILVFTSSGAHCETSKPKSGKSQNEASSPSNAAPKQLAGTITADGKDPMLDCGFCRTDHKMICRDECFDQFSGKPPANCIPKCFEAKCRTACGKGKKRAVAKKKPSTMKPKS